MVTAASGLPNHSQTFSIATTVRRLPNGVRRCPPPPPLLHRLQLLEMLPAKAPITSHRPVP
jgi:hypothetical protein